MTVDLPGSARRNRLRRLGTIDRLIPILAAGVGLLALAGTLMVQLNTDAAQRAAIDDVAKMEATVSALGQAPAAPSDSSEVAALTDRVAKLEADLQQARDDLAKVMAAGTTPAPLTFGDASATPGATTPAAAKPIDPSLPTKDCIPLGTRFMATPNSTFPLCQSKQKIKVGAITDDTAFVDGAGPIVETGFGKLPGSTCTVMVFSADAAGFAEMRVTCE